ncbi:hypothetical protein FSP39_002380 [Pinctada imbricata]|uniref:DUF19 domain-containing protein n=1 Tax=Pinctada imbricata TaxID=66713 RepID=A0AA89C158_PINIB|nr:hypothetical protein FSP39_002380 [Pinctada imbricata]
MTNGNFQLEVIFSLITNGSSGPLPQGSNRDQLVQTLCQNRQNIEACAQPIPQGVNMNCQQREQMMMDSTVQSTGRAVATLCGVQPEMPPCLKKFDTKFKGCMSQKNVNPENYFKLLANTTEGTGMNFDQLRKQTCSKTEQQTIVQCATSSLQSLVTECTKQEQFMVGQTLQNMMASYQSVCTGKPLIGPNRPPSPCLQKFEDELEKCSMETMKVSTVDVMMLLTKGQVPDGQDMSQLNQTICKNFHAFEKCGKKVIKSTQCKGRDLLISEGTFANMVITIGAYCHDTSVPGACMLTLQQSFTKCFGQVGLNPEAYFSNQTAHKGALLGTTREMATQYCNKRHDLYTCMKKVMHQCPGAEQTMTLTGFDLTSMERAVGVLCNDIPEYLAGLDCFAEPSAAARRCIDNMGRDITSMSARQMAKGLSLDGFFQDFCKIRVDHVSCDANAWATCDPKAVQLKTKFECLLLPARCHNINEDDIVKICPADAIVKPHTCLDDVEMSINNCLTPYSINADMFVVNITHDRSAMLGSKQNAQNFCRNRKSIHKCLTKAVDNCPGASEMLAYWGHQQNLLEKSLKHSL